MSDLRDIIERLRDRTGYWHSMLRNEAADEIASLRKNHQRAQERFQELDAEIASLRTQRDGAVEGCEVALARVLELEVRLASARKALEPFAKAGELFKPRLADSFNELVYGPAAGDAYNITGDDLRAAKAAYTDEEGKS